MSRAPLAKRRPVCVHCGLRYGRRATHHYTLRWEDGEPEPSYPGNLVVVRRGSVREARGAMIIPAWGAGVSPGRLTPIPGQRHARDIEVWDGQTWIAPYEPFCTLRCALGFARKAYARGQGGAR